MEKISQQDFEVFIYDLVALKKALLISSTVLLIGYYNKLKLILFAIYQCSLITCLHYQEIILRKGFVLISPPLFSFRPRLEAAFV